jgi:acetoin utilization deacetylase AcuC-like enzyme
MTIVYTNKHQLHRPPYEFYDGKRAVNADQAERADVIIAALREQSEHTIIAPKEFPLSHLYAIHHERYVSFLKDRSADLGDGRKVLYPSYFLSDTHAPVTGGTYEASLAAVNAALTGAELILKGELAVYALCRPPGHHAAHHTTGGYCYFNNAAIAAEYLSARGRVAILDIDYHHGNGTQDAFYDRESPLYISLHADPTDAYPFSSGFTDEKGYGPGVGYNINYPLPPETDNKLYLATLEKALNDIKKFRPDFLIVSAGFDTFEDDTIGGLGLTIPAYTEIGGMIHALDLPTLLVQEGGYDIPHLPVMTTNFLRQFSSATS